MRIDTKPTPRIAQAISLQWLRKIRSQPQSCSYQSARPLSASRPSATGPDWSQSSSRARLPAAMAIPPTVTRQAEPDAGSSRCQGSSRKEPPGRCRRGPLQAGQRARVFAWGTSWSGALQGRRPSVEGEEEAGPKTRPPRRPPVRLLCRVCRPLLFAGLQPLAFAVHFQYVDVVRQPVQQRPGQPF